MTGIERLLKNIKIFQDVGALDEEFEIFAEENPDLDSINDLNKIMETEMSYWGE